MKERQAAQKLFRRRWLYLALMALVMGVIFWFSAQPAAASQGMSDGFLAWLLDGRVPFLSWLANSGFFEWFNIRKCAHAFVYGTLGVLAALFVGTWRGPGWKLAAYAWLISVLYACSDEWHQAFVPGRSCELRDVLIDAGGALAGVLLIWLVRSIKEKRKRRTVTWMS